MRASGLLQPAPREAIERARRRVRLGRRANRGEGALDAGKPGWRPPVARRIAKVCGTACLLLVVAGGSLLILPADRRARPQYFRIESGQSFGQVEARLAKVGLVTLKGPLRIWARVTGRDRQVHSGTYELSAAQTPLEILRTLVAGEAIVRRVTIPEGFTQQAILARLAEELAFSVGPLLQAVGDTAWVRSLGVPGPPLEGYLFPETYLFDPSLTPREVLAEMVRVCLGHLSGERRVRAAELGLTDHALLTLASIIELEAADPAERRRISAIYRNRLERGLLLQADPTVAYAAGRIGQRLTARDLEVASPYNTYLYSGLPPGPICSPGLGSIDAALWPLEDCQEFYFVARGDGTHVFSKTLEEHNRARLEVERAQGGSALGARRSSR
jgi:UPF0755 protein